MVFFLQKVYILHFITSIHIWLRNRQVYLFIILFYYWILYSIISIDESLDKVRGVATKNTRFLVRLQAISHGWNHKSSGLRSVWCVMSESCITWLSASVYSEVLQAKCLKEAIIMMERWKIGASVFYPSGLALSGFSCCLESMKDVWIKNSCPFYWGDEPADSMMEKIFRPILRTLPSSFLGKEPNHVVTFPRAVISTEVEKSPFSIAQAASGPEISRLRVSIGLDTFAPISTCSSARDDNSQNRVLSFDNYQNL